MTFLAKKNQFKGFNSKEEIQKLGSNGKVKISNFAESCVLKISTENTKKSRSYTFHSVLHLVSLLFLNAIIILLTTNYTCGGNTLLK